MPFEPAGLLDFDKYQIGFISFLKKSALFGKNIVNQSEFGYFLVNLPNQCSWICYPLTATPAMNAIGFGTAPIVRRLSHTHMDHPANSLA
ncbi:hypothetical protein GV829_00005 [Sphingomonas lacunae]|uniref:Uncharacterized protein n=1 Tax=Sphingomonas lacunae TaxID=2698828 RepID=A0A6M4ASJ9_9SPHN|nr:hypothetical protein [Sphingomonas lacunae]QJQ31039.1 hypothetical protein GV829_00005 [Sphingomonas lacunae]